METDWREAEGESMGHSMSTILILMKHVKLVMGLKKLPYTKFQLPKILSIKLQLIHQDRHPKSLVWLCICPSGPINCKCKMWCIAKRKKKERKKEREH